MFILYRIISRYDFVYDRFLNQIRFCSSSYREQRSKRNQFYFPVFVFHMFVSLPPPPNPSITSIGVKRNFRITSIILNFPIYVWSNVASQIENVLITILSIKKNAMLGLVFCFYCNFVPKSIALNVQINGVDQYVVFHIVQKISFLCTRFLWKFCATFLPYLWHQGNIYSVNDMNALQTNYKAAVFFF